MKIVLFVLFAVLVLAGTACDSNVSKKPETLTEEQLEAREDSLDFVVARSLQTKISAAIQADIETRPMSSANVDDDAADDMAIWVNRAHPEKSTLIGTNKKGGVAVYDLQGRDLAFYPTGRINNIDVLYGFALGSEKIDLVGCTNRSDQSIDLFRINPADGTLTDIAADALTVDTNQVKDVYGFCFYHRTRPYLFINGKNGAVQQFELVATPDRKIAVKLVRQVAFDSQTEGMVADEAAAVLYIGEEDKGVWKMPADPDGGDTRTLLALSGNDNPNITYDVEGLALYREGDGGYLLVSSQGNFSYAVFERQGDNHYLGSFKVVDGPTVDGIEETDGIEAVSASLGEAFPRGLFVAQDGFNYDGGRQARQNFKLVRWEKIAALLKDE